MIYYKLEKLIKLKIKNICYLFLMSNIDKEGIVIIVISLAITVVLLLCIKCYYSNSSNKFSKMSHTINNVNIMNHERTRLI
jgi:hypothetical protein